MNTPVSTKHAAHYTWGGDCDGWHLLKTPAATVIQERMPPGRAEARHFHRRSQQFFFVLAGQAMMEVDGETIRLRQHEGCFIAAGIPHRIRNAAKVASEFLVFSVPPSHGDRVPAAPVANKPAKLSAPKRIKPRP